MQGIVANPCEESSTSPGSIRHGTRSSSRPVCKTIDVVTKLCLTQDLLIVGSTLGYAIFHRLSLLVGVSTIDHKKCDFRAG